MVVLKHGRIQAGVALDTQVTGATPAVQLTDSEPSSAARSLRPLWPDARKLRRSTREEGGDSGTRWALLRSSGISRRTH